MSAARQLAIADIQNQIARAELAKTQNFYGAPGRTVQSTDINVDGQTVTEQEAQARIGVLESEQTQDNITDQAAKQAKIAQQKIGLGILNFANGSKQRAKQINRSLGSIPTPGDVWVPFWILIFMFMVMIPVGGHTRLNWLWMVIIGHAELSSEYQLQQNPSSVLPGLGLLSTNGTSIFTTTTTTGAAIGTGQSPTSGGSTGSSTPSQQIITPTQPVFGGTHLVPYLTSINSGEF